jgi:hypothetical protein
MPTRTTDQVRKDIATEREQLASAIDELRASVGAAANVAEKVRERLPLVAGAAASAGFVLAGGIGATMRYFARRGRDRNERLRLGRFSIVDRD